MRKLFFFVPLAMLSAAVQAAPSWTIRGFDSIATSTSVALIWQTGPAPTDAVVNVGLSASDLSFRSVPITTFATVQTVNLPGLSPSTRYYFQVVATDQDGYSQTSGVISKTTKPASP